MPLNFKHINANEQILDGSIGTSLLADGSVTAAKLAIGAITSSSFLVDSNIDFNNFQALQFRVENVNFFPIPGNPGRLIWRTDLRDLFVDSDYTLNITAARYIPLEVGVIIDGQHMTVNDTTGIVAGDAILQHGVPFSEIDILAITDGTHFVVDSTAGIAPGFVITQDAASTTVTTVVDATHLIVTNTSGFVVDVAVVSTPFSLTTVTSVTDGTHLVVVDTTGFVGQAIAQVDFGIVTVTDGIHLVVDNSTAIAAGYTITQGLFSTTVTSVTDLTHIVVADTTGFVPGITIVHVPFDVLAIPDLTHLTVSTTAGFGPGDVITQGLASTTITTVVDATHLVVGSTNGFALNAAADSTVIVNDTTNVNAGMYLRQGVISSLVIEVVDATHLAVANATGFIAGAAFVGNWVSINEGASVTSVYSDSNPHLHGDIQFLSGTNVQLPQVNQTITVNVPAAGNTGYVQFNNDVSNNFGANANLFWDNPNTRLGIGTALPNFTLDVTGNGHFTSDVTVDTAVHTPLVTGTSPLELRPGTDGTAGIKLAKTDGTRVVTIDTINSILGVFGTAGINNDTNATLYFNNDAQSTTFGTVGADSTGLAIDVNGNVWAFNTLGNLTNPGSVYVPSGSVGIGTSTPDASALLDVTSTTHGALVPRMTTAQRDLIVSPAIGLLIYNLDSNLFNFWTGISWLPVGSPVGNVGDVQFNAGGGLFGADPNFYWDIANAELGIGTATPDLSAVLDLTSTTRGFLVPRMTQAQRDAVVSPAVGLQIYNTDSTQFNYYTGTTWIAVIGNDSEVLFNSGGQFGAHPKLTFDPGGLNSVLQISQGPFNSQNAILRLESNNGQAGQIIDFTLGGVTQSAISRSGNSSGLDFSGNSQFRFAPDNANTTVTMNNNTLAVIDDDGAGSNAEIRLEFNAPDNGILNFTNVGNSVQHSYISQQPTGGQMNFVNFEGGLYLYPSNNANGYVSLTGSSTLDLTMFSDQDKLFRFKNASGSTEFANMDFTSSGIQINHLSGPIFIQGGPGAIYTWRFNADSTMSTPGAVYVNQLTGTATLDVAGTGHFSNSLVVDTTVGIGTAAPLVASNFQLLVTDSAATRAGIRLVSQTGTYGVVEFEGAPNNANLQIRASADATDIAVSSIANLRFDAASITWTLQTDGRISSSLSEILFDRPFGQTNDNGGYLFFNNAANTHTYANLVAGNDDTFKITGQNDIAKWFINSGYIVFGLNDFTQSPNAFFTVRGWSATRVASNEVLNVHDNSGAVGLTAGDDAFASVVPMVLSASQHNFTNGPVGMQTAIYSGQVNDASALLQLNSTDRGFLPPRMTTAERDAIASPATGLIIYNTDTNLLQIYNGTSWTPIGQAIFQQDIFDIVGPGNVFNLSFTPITNSQVVYYNGLALAPGVTEDYTISGNVVTLNGSIVLINGDKILIVYSHY